MACGCSKARAVTAAEPAPPANVEFVVLNSNEGDAVFATLAEARAFQAANAGRVRSRAKTEATN
jgi:hypothetical protein